MLEGVRFVRRTGVEQIARYERSLLTRMVQGLHALEEIQVFASQTQNQTGVVSFVCPQYDSQLMAQALGRREIAVRGGLHCAPQAHRSAGLWIQGRTGQIFPPLIRDGKLMRSFRIFNKLFMTN